MQHLIRFAALAVGMSCVALWATNAQAQLGRGDLRLSLDTDMLAVAKVDVDVDPGGDTEATVISVGPNQLGGSRVVQDATPLGVGIGYTMTPKLVLGLRTGIGADFVDYEGSDDTIRMLAVSLMPGLTWVPLGHKAKLFIAMSALFQVDRIKQDENKDRVMLGGFSTGIGTLIFPTSRFSVDLGFFFEGRFGGREYEPERDDEDVRDLRGVVRLGFSLWT